MEAKRLAGTDESPEVILDKTTSEFKFTGKSLPEDVKEFYNPILEWIEKYVQNPNEETVVEFNMEYFNSASSKQILDILERFSMLKENGKKVAIKWHYLHDDEDMEDAGESYADIVDVPFELISY
ncbi:MAG TPA: nuclear pore complex subunit [Marinilabiliales bacterium]|jgi:hypothetical protein|nr:DUF1987 domain-containing protein [Salinivirgaceae bacterium]OFX38479.1 MAG: nuclear pore complex subunit [Bacteroidetes bacterium GWA2_40_14]OFX61190.1 MAG: nuclear pore complex subunit [Bacteroidetes bacterium GWC2_40_13]OFX75276.1 MAG: nuclear pore complex subunit [Bacteroidetes bacterium GWD2_40_43]OFX89873.1 MAG: nuclear pore complex subunit [Bacteroidetes bacterium GWE2_40_63]OFY17789.1 MAG: nuclear pore complex subunit [Bacteroidetes bacterium GWF2_40_13]OFZ30281.1 MAG: nuclear pore